MTLVERDAELEAIAAALGSAAAGRGVALLFEGEAGIGKTRLLERARVDAEAKHARVLFTTADPEEAGVPLGVARALLLRAARDLELDGPAAVGMRALRGELGAVGGRGSRADEVLHGVWWLLAELAHDRPLLVIVDDAQWADELTLRLLRLTARRVAELPVALIVAVRQAAAGDPHATLVAERAFLRLEPAPLTPAGTARVLAAALRRPGSVEEVAHARAVTGGNPLYLTELLHDM